MILLIRCNLSCMARISNFFMSFLLLLCSIFYCRTFLRKPRNLPFLFSVRLLAAFGSLSRLERTRSKVMRARSAQGTAPE